MATSTAVAGTSDQGKPQLLNEDNAYTEFRRILQISQEFMSARPDLFNPDTVKAITKLASYEGSFDQALESLAKRLFLLQRRIYARIKNYREVDDSCREWEIEFWHKETNYFMRLVYIDVRHLIDPPPPLTEDQQRDLEDSIAAYTTYDEPF